MKSRNLGGASALALLVAAGLSGPAFAQDDTVEEVVVTGSLIRGTPEDAALPVDVIGAEDLAKQGNPSTVDLIKSLPSSQGVLGDSNQFDSRAQGSEGIGSINLRGLGASRTLVLLNGRRLTPAGFTGVVDTNMIPSAAIGRIEVLKDGAAVTYGSEAIAGVVNFISPTNFEGFQIAADYTFIDASDGDYGASAKWGWVGDNGNIFIATGYQRRSKLPVYERDWANRPYEENPEGGWTGANNPGVFSAIGLPGLQRDSQCESLGGLPGVFTIASGLPQCRWRFANWDNLVEPETRWQTYAEANADLAENVKLHVDALYSKTDVTMNTSPGYSLVNSTNAAITPAPYGSLGYYFVPGTNPGLLDYALKNQSQFPVTAIPGSNGALILPPIFYRPFSVGGNPLFGDIGAAEGVRDYELARISGELSGEFENGIGWNTSVTYSQSKNYGSQYDIVTSRFQRALMGFGGEGCDPATGTAGVGACKWFYPFSNSVEMNQLTGVTNPQFNPAYANTDKDLIGWFYQEQWRQYITRQFVAEAVVNGELPIELPGGKIGWAVGGQYRLYNFNSDISDGWNLAVNPCIDTPVTGNTACAVKNGPLVFLGGFIEQDLEQTAYAAFTEFNIPVTDDINVQLAARYEDYGGGVGSTFDPKVSARWQINDILALRGSYSTTFRAPNPATLTGQGTSLQSFFGQFRPVDIVGVDSLEPESATTYSVGAAVRFAGLRATIDYWGYDFDNPLGIDPAGSMVNTFFTPILGADGKQLVDSEGRLRWVGCESADYAGLKSRFTFGATGCGTTFSRLRTEYNNGAAIKTTGIDLLADYDLPWRPMDAEITIGTSVSYVLEYTVDDFFVEGVKVQDGFDGVGLLNYQTSIVPIPQWKGQFYSDFTLGQHNLRLTVNYIDSYTDQRGAAIYGPHPVLGVVIPEGKTIDETITLDAAYRVFLPWDTTAIVRVSNVFDRDPSFARLDLNYDPFTGNPLGRTVKVSLSKKF